MLIGEPYFGRQARPLRVCQLSRMSSSTSERLGMLGIAPAVCTHSVAAEAANRSASSGDCALSSATANAAVKQSPAPVVSTTLVAGTAGCRRVPDSARASTRRQADQCTMCNLAHLTVRVDETLHSGLKVYTRLWTHAAHREGDFLDHILVTRS